MNQSKCAIYSLKSCIDLLYPCCGIRAKAILSIRYEDPDKFNPVICVILIKGSRSASLSGGRIWIHTLKVGNGSGSIKVRILSRVF